MTLWNRNANGKTKPKRQKRHQIEKYVAPHILLMVDYKAVRHWITLMGLFCSNHPIHWTGSDSGRETESERWRVGGRSLSTDWSFKLCCFILGDCSNLGVQKGCVTKYFVGPLVFRRYAFVSGCFPRVPVILLGTLHTFLPTLLLVVTNQISQQPTELISLGIRSTRHALSDQGYSETM